MRHLISDSLDFALSEAKPPNLKSLTRCLLTAALLHIYSIIFFYSILFKKKKNSIKSESRSSLLRGLHYGPRVGSVCKQLRGKKARKSTQSPARLWYSLDVSLAEVRHYYSEQKGTMHTFSDSVQITLSICVIQ